MKLILGTTELADIPNHVAEQLLRLFPQPGNLKADPAVSSVQDPHFKLEQLDSPNFAPAGDYQRFDLALEITTTVHRQA